MKKYNVKFYLNTSVEYEIEAESEKEAINKAEDMQYDMSQILENMMPAGKCDVEEID